MSHLLQIFSETKRLVATAVCRGSLQPGEGVTITGSLLEAVPLAAWAEELADPEEVLLLDGTTLNFFLPRPEKGKGGAN